MPRKSHKTSKTRKSMLCFPNHSGLFKQSMLLTPKISDYEGFYPLTRLPAYPLTLFSILIIPMIWNPAFSQVSCGGFSEPTQSKMVGVPQTMVKEGLFGNIAKRFPIQGEINALIVFAQFKDDNNEDCRTFDGYNADGEPTFTIEPYANCENRGSDSWQVGGYQSISDDPVSEWPADLPNVDTYRRQLPAWAAGLIDIPNSTTITEGSLTDIYNRYSNEKFRLRGRIWPYTYRMQQNQSWYNPNKGMFENGGVKASHEILTYVKNNNEGISFYGTSMWDQYTNGNGGSSSGDNKFDMIIIVYRTASLLILGADTRGNALTSLGASGHTGNSFASAPIFLGSYEVIDNDYSGSGVICSGFSKKVIQQCIMHEIGHRQFGLYHTGEHGGTQSEKNSFTVNNFSIMNGGPWLGFSAPDRILLNWAKPLVINIETAFPSYYSNYPYNLVGSGDLPTSSEYDAMVILENDGLLNGKLVIEHLKSDVSLHKSPAQSGDDGDTDDSYLSTEGLMFYKINTHPLSSQQPRSFVNSSSSLPNGGRKRRWRHGINDKQLYSTSDTYTPFTKAKYEFYTPSVSTDYDQRIAITDISITSNGASFKVWRDFLGSSDSWKKIGPYSTFGLESIGRINDWEVGTGRFVLLTGFLSNQNSTFSPQIDSLGWGGFYIPNHNVVVENVTMNNVGTQNNTTAVNFSNAGAALLKKNKILTNAHHNIPDINAIYATGSSSYNIQLEDNEIKATGTGVWVNSSATVFAHGNDIHVTNSSFPVIHVDNYGRFRSRLPTYPYDGRNKLKGGEFGIKTGFGALVESGNSGGTNHLNHFCDNARKIIGNYNSSIYIHNNYWSTGGPILTYNSGNIFYGNSKGYASCAFSLKTNNQEATSIIDGQPSYPIMEKIVSSAHTREEGNKAAEQFLKAQVNSESPFKMEALLGYANFLLINDRIEDLLLLEPEISSKRSLSQDQLMAWSSIKENADRIMNAGLIGQNNSSGLPVLDLGNDSTAEEEFSLITYPNPFNPSVMVAVETKSFQSVSIQIFDVLGRKVAQKVATGLGVVQHRFDSQTWSSGLYLVEIRVAGQVFIQKISLVK